jgi:DNA-binding transcriptional ArsR family regulator
VLADADLSTIAELMSGHRAALLLALTGGRPLGAGELAAHAQISPSLASAHLSKLLDGKLVAVEQDGRRRRYRLAGPHVAEVIEAMLTLAPQRRAASLREAGRGRAIREARTCYDHLAGALGVAVTDGLERRRIIRRADAGYELTPAGETWLGELGVDVAVVRRARRTFARPCLDWTERRFHLAGALGAALATRFLELGWVERRAGTRGLRVTEAGSRELREQLLVNLAPAR